MLIFQFYYSSILNLSKCSNSVPIQFLFFQWYSLLREGRIKANFRKIVGSLASFKDMTLDFQSFKQVIVQCTDVPSEDVTHPRREKRIWGGNWQALNQGRGQASEVGTQGGAEQADKPRVC